MGIAKLDYAEEDYKDWLVGQVNTVEDYRDLLYELYSIEFYSLIKYDEDRGMDGMALREEWASKFGYEGSLDFGGPNVLEVLIGIAKRIEFQIYGPTYMYEWDYVRVFWDLIDNLGLGHLFGDLFCDSFDEIHSKVTHFLERDYIRHRNGNIFDFNEWPKHIRKLNIWDQMTIYIREKWPI